MNNVWIVQTATKEEVVGKLVLDVKIVINTSIILILKVVYTEWYTQKRKEMYKSLQIVSCHA